MKIIDMLFLASGSVLVGLFTHDLYSRIVEVCADSLMQVSCVTRGDIVDIICLVIIVTFISTLIYKVYTQSNAED